MFSSTSQIVIQKLFEHHNYPNGKDISEIESEVIPYKPFFGKKDRRCFEVQNLNGKKSLHTSYYVGVDWLVEKDLVISVEPKLNDKDQKVDFLWMLYAALKHPEVAQHTNELLEVKFVAPFIEIEQQQQDLITPLFIFEFLRVVKEIVRKGLKRSYYKVEHNLQSRVKGKVLVAKTIKDNLLKNKPLKTYCSFDEFGLNSLENRLIKRALIYVQRYTYSLRHINSAAHTSELLNYILPAFDGVSSEVNLHEVRQLKINKFYKEYEEGVKLAKIILANSGYNLNSTKTTLKIPPFWIDMSKLFELYVLGLLKDRFGNKVHYHFKRLGNELDFILDTKSYQMVIDAKYKTRYQESFKNEDIRQVSGYARLQSVYDELGKDYSEIIDCLIIYPDQEKGNEDLSSVDLIAQEHAIDEFVQVFKIPVKLPILM